MQQSKQGIEDGTFASNAVVNIGQIYRKRQAWNF